MSEILHAISLDTTVFYNMKFRYTKNTKSRKFCELNLKHILIDMGFISLTHYTLRRTSRRGTIHFEGRGEKMKRKDVEGERSDVNCPFLPPHYFVNIVCGSSIIDTAMLNTNTDRARRS